MIDQLTPFGNIPSITIRFNFLLISLREIYLCPNFADVKHPCILPAKRVECSGEKDLPHLFVVPKYVAILHDEYDFLKRRDVLQGITRNGNDIG